MPDLAQPVLQKKILYYEYASDLIKHLTHKIFEAVYFLFYFHF